METFTPISALVGGIIIGGSAILLMVLLGRIAGISGIVGGLLPPPAGEAGWRLAFLFGLVAGPVLWGLVGGFVPPVEVTSAIPVLIAGGLLVGFGTSLGSGCTSGHGVCGLARLSPRSLVATLTFMAVAVATVFVTRHVIGG
ncbi:MAG TPA: YeeE/YedE thiosulfate transporter family protein [Alphaproteobacteria bacterium]|nr:YeeE/YedE thiosulfate transporter family protein [Alphaproteobacteria bacterium]